MDKEEIEGGTKICSQCECPLESVCESGTLNFVKRYKRIHCRFV